MIPQLYICLNPHCSFKSTDMDDVIDHMELEHPDMIESIERMQAEDS